MIVQYLDAGKESLRACSRPAHDFRYVAQSFLGRHIRVTEVNRLKECALLIARGTFQHVRSLDLGVDKKDVILEEYWKDYIDIFGSFSRYRSLNRLWLSEVTFIFTRPSQKKTLGESVTALGSTTTELGLYGCHFCSDKRWCHRRGSYWWKRARWASGEYAHYQVFPTPCFLIE